MFAIESINVKPTLLVCAVLSVCISSVQGAGQDPAPLARILAAQGTNPVTVTFKVEVRAGTLCQSCGGAAGVAAADAVASACTGPGSTVPAELRASRSEWEKRLAGRLEPISGDPDGAKWQVAQGDVTGVTLHYLRNDRYVEFASWDPP